MKRWIHSAESNVEEITSSETTPEGKLKRTPESGHLIKDRMSFDSVEDLAKWWEEDKLYED